MPAQHRARGLLAAFAGLSCLTAAGCASGRTAAITAHDQPGTQGSAGTSATASTVLPAQLGNTWVYAVDSSVLGKGTETARISAVSGQRATLSSSLRLAGSKAPFRFSSDFTVSADGSVTFASTSFMGSRLASANVNWPSPAALTQGQPRTSTVTGSFLGFRTTERVTITDVGPAMVTVPAGSYQATLLEQSVADHAGGGQEVVKSWVVNGIGQVKTETTVIVKGAHPVTSVQMLTSFIKG